MLKSITMANESDYESDWVRTLIDKNGSSFIKKIKKLKSQKMSDVMQHNRHLPPGHVEGVRIRLPHLREGRYQSTVNVLVHNVR